MKVGMGPDQNFFDPGWVPSMVWVWIWKISPKNVKFFIFFLRVKKYRGQRRVGLLFTAGQKYARVGSGPISS